jgi:hypothetical protein
VQSKYNDLSVGFICLTTITDDWRAGQAAKLNDQTGIWEKDVSNRMGPNGDAELFSILNKTIRVFRLKSKNSSGFISTEDDSMGPEYRRERKMIFCLLHDTQALCGRGYVMRLEEPRSNMLPDALKTLQGIEFVDE